jgi:hypothetical protein
MYCEFPSTSRPITYPQNLWNWLCNCDNKFGLIGDFVFSVLLDLLIMESCNSGWCWSASLYSVGWRFSYRSHSSASPCRWKVYKERLRYGFQLTPWGGVLLWEAVSHSGVQEFPRILWGPSPTLHSVLNKNNSFLTLNNPKSLKMCCIVTWYIVHLLSGLFPSVFVTEIFYPFPFCPMCSKFFIRENIVAVLHKNVSETYIPFVVWAND